MMVMEVITIDKTLYVGNLPWATTEDQLKELFDGHGQVQDCRIITERGSGRSKGYGFVEVDVEDIEKVIEVTNGMEVEGRKIVVNEARPRDGQ